MAKAKSALIPKPVLQPHSPSPESARLIPVSLIDPNPYQPRHELSADDIAELTLSIKANGLIEPIVVCPQQEDGAPYPSKAQSLKPEARGLTPVPPLEPRATSLKPRFTLIAGYRRLTACKSAGLTEVLCIVREGTDSELLELALIENVQRQNLNPIEEAEGYRSLMKLTGMTQQDVARKVNKSEGLVAERLALLKLPSYIQEAVAQKKIAIHAALEIGRIENEKRRRSLFERAHKLNFDDLKATVQKALDRQRTGRKRYQKRSPDPLFKDIFKDLPVKRVYKDQVTFLFSDEAAFISALEQVIARWKATEGKFEN